jgi:hypothetical protein
MINKLGIDIADDTRVSGYTLKNSGTTEKKIIDTPKKK